MNIYIIRSISILCFTLCLACTLSAQNNIEKSYTWDGTSDEVTLSMKVRPGVDALSMAFDGKISKGNLVVTGFDPEGNHACGFCLITDCSLSCGKARETGNDGKSLQSGKNIKCNTSSSTQNGVTKTEMTSTGNGYSYMCTSTEDVSGARGNAIETISDPTPGEWTFVIEAIQVKGTLEVSIKQD